MEPGTGSVNAFMFGRGDFANGSLGLGLDVDYRINSDLSAFASASAGYQYGDNSGLAYDFLAGIEGTF